MVCAQPRHRCPVRRPSAERRPREEARTIGQTISHDRGDDSILALHDTSLDEILVFELQAP